MSKNGMELKLKLFVTLVVAAAVAAVVAAVSLYFYIGRKDSADGFSDGFGDKLAIGSSFTVDDVIADTDYKYGWLKNGVNAEILVESADGEYKERGGVIEYSDDTRTLDVVGVGSGKIIFRNPVDSSVSFEVPFTTRFDSADMSAVLQKNRPDITEDGVIGAEELATVTEITLDTTDGYDVGDLGRCAALERVMLTSADGVAMLKGLDGVGAGVTFYVASDVYAGYMGAETWRDYRTRVFPLVNSDKAYRTLVFEFNGGVMSGASGERHFAVVENGGSIKTADYAVARTGYTFKGWYISDDNGQTLSIEVNDGTTFAADKKLYASWKINEYDIVYNGNADDADGDTVPDGVHVEYGKTVAISDKIPTRTGHTFLGWATDKTATETEYAAGEKVKSLTERDGATVTLYAVWATNDYSIVFDANGGSGAPEDISGIKFGEEAQISEAEPIRTGYTFVGWARTADARTYEFKAGQTVKNLVSGANGVLRLYAVWTANDYRIVYNANGKNADGIPAVQNCKYGTTVKLDPRTPVCKYFKFDGWATAPTGRAEYSSGQSVSNLVSAADGTVTLYAVWSSDEFDIAYDANGGSGAPYNSLAVRYGSKYMNFAKSQPSRTGHTFKGWSETRITSVKNTSSHVEYTVGQTLEASDVNALYELAYGNDGTATLYAVWEINQYKITVTQGDKGGSVSWNGANVNGKYYDYGTYMSLSISYSKGDSRKFEIDGVSKGAVTSYGFTMPASDVTFKVSSSSSCLTSDTRVNTENGYKKVKDLQQSDKILAWDFVNGQAVSLPISYLINHGEDYYDVTVLSFEDGSELEIIGKHYLFDISLRRFVDVSDGRYLQYIGDEFMRFDGIGRSYTSVKLTGGTEKVEYTGAWGLASVYHLNCITENMVSIAPVGQGFNELTETYLKDDLSFDKETFLADAEKYGLYDYSIFEPYMSRETFDVFGFAYFKLSVEKGFTTFDEIMYYVKTYIAG